MMMVKKWGCEWMNQQRMSIVQSILSSLVSDRFGCIKCAVSYLCNAQLFLIFFPYFWKRDKESDNMGRLRVRLHNR